MEPELPRRPILPSNESLQRLTLILGSVAGLFAFGSALSPDRRGAVIVSLVLGLLLIQIHLGLLIADRREPVLEGAQGEWKLGRLRPAAIGLFSLILLGFLVVVLDPIKRAPVVQALKGSGYEWNDSLWVAYSRGYWFHLIDFIASNESDAPILIERIEMTRKWRNAVPGCVEETGISGVGEEFTVTDVVSVTGDRRGELLLRGSIRNDADTAFIYPLKGSRYEGHCGGWISVTLPVAFEIPATDHYRVRLRVPESLGLVPPIGAEGRITIRAIGRTGTLYHGWTLIWAPVMYPNDSGALIVHDSILRSATPPPGTDPD